VVFHSWALTYFTDAGAFEDALRGVARREGRTVWWVSMEPPRTVPGLEVPRRDPRYSEPLAANTVTALVTIEPDGARTDEVLARSQPHGDWVHWLA
jgi:hypothetical protein